MEDGTAYLYVAAYQQVKSIAKLTLKGELIWQKYAPMQSGHYAPVKPAIRNGHGDEIDFFPRILHFFQMVNYSSQMVMVPTISTVTTKTEIGCHASVGPAKVVDRSTFPTAYGSTREGEILKLLLLTVQTIRCRFLISTARTRRPLMDSDYLQILIPTEPCLCPNWQHGFHFLTDSTTLLSHLDDRERVLKDKQDTKNFSIRTNESQWQEKFVHPHDACFDLDNNIYVAEWGVLVVSPTDPGVNPRAHCGFIALTPAAKSVAFRRLIMPVGKHQQPRKREGNPGRVGCDWF